MPWQFLNWLFPQKIPRAHHEELAFNEISRRVKNIELITRKKAEVQLVGQYRSRFRGQGMQFSDVRVYQYGDDVRHIDWRSSARSQQTYIKTYEEEREQNLLLVVDISASTNFASTGSTKREATTVGLASVAFSAAMNRDNIGLLLFSDKIEKYIPPQKGRRHILHLIDELLYFKPISQNTEMNQVLKILPNLLKHTTIIFLASDFNTSMKENLLKKISSKHDLIAVHCTDPKELALPNIGLVQVKDPESGKIVILDTGSTSIRQEFLKNQLRWQDKIRQTFQSMGASYISISTDRDPGIDIRNFFQTRKRNIK